MVRAMDVATALTLAVVINHEIPSLVQELQSELMLDRERKAMQLEDLAVQGMTGRLYANVDLAHEPDEGEYDYIGPLCSWVDLVESYAVEAGYPPRS